MHCLAVQTAVFLLALKLSEGSKMSLIKREKLYHSVLVELHTKTKYTLSSIFEMGVLFVPQLYCVLFLVSLYTSSSSFPH